jgi:hypothetical protein
MGRPVAPWRALLGVIVALAAACGGGYSVGAASTEGGQAAPPPPQGPFPSPAGETYVERRRRELAAEASAQAGGDIALTPRERAADAILRASRAIDLATAPPIPAVHFFEAKQRIEAGRVYLIGLGRIVALYKRASTSYQIPEHNRCIYF